jgi:hypothetical protein
MSMLKDDTITVCGVNNPITLYDWDPITFGQGIF